MPSLICSRMSCKMLESRISLELHRLQLLVRYTLTQLLEVETRFFICTSEQGGQKLHSWLVFSQRGSINLQLRTHLLRWTLRRSLVLLILHSHKMLQQKHMLMLSWMVLTGSNQFVRFQQQTSLFLELRLLMVFLWLLEIAFSLLVNRLHQRMESILSLLVHGHDQQMQMVLEK